MGIIVKFFNQNSQQIAHFSDKRTFWKFENLLANGDAIKIVSLKYIHLDELEFEKRALRTPIDRKRV